MNTRFLKDEQVLFKANKVEFESNEPIQKPKQLKKELASISQMQPNKKFIGLFQTRLWFYNVASRRKPTKFRYWMKNKVGEEPVYYDESLALKSTVLIQNYLINKGYFYANVDFKTDIKRKKATITYFASGKDLYRINSVQFPQEKNRINDIINERSENSFLKPGDPFDVSVLKKERERISDDLRNSGYYLFNREFVYFDLDSNTARRKMDLFVRINPPHDSLEHEMYYINNVYVFTDFSLEQLKQEVIYDTVQVREYYFVSRKLKIKPSILIQSIHFRHDSLYTKNAHKHTINHLSDLGIFKFVNIKFEEITIDGKNYLNCLIYLSPAKKQEMSVEAEANNNTDYALGTLLTLTYRNKNIFRGAEHFSFSISGGFESNLERGQNFFNTIDLSAKADLLFNKFIVPFGLKRIPKESRPKTKISLKNDYLRRIEYYTTNSTSLTFGYDWNRGITKRHIFNPIVVNVVAVQEATDKFLEIISRSQSLRNSFTEQLILGAEYTYIWTNQPIHTGNYFFFYRGGIDISGNVLYGISKLIHLKDNKKPPYEAFGVNYSQYFLIDSDIRNYYDFHKHGRLVSRIFGGIGIPYGNSTSLTYLKQFFSGGANDLRAWRIRTLGPGSFQDTISFDQTGEVKLAANIELRFDIFKFFKGAAFIDAGNVWILKNDPLRKGANFDFARFWNEFAIGAGLGVRFDFSYFVLRFDVALKFRDPSKGSDRWVIKDFEINNRTNRRENMKFNLAIGYPF